MFERIPEEIRRALLELNFQRKIDDLLRKILEKDDEVDSFKTEDGKTIENIKEIIKNITGKPYSMNKHILRMKRKTQDFKEDIFNKLNVKKDNIRFEEHNFTLCAEK